MSFNYVFGYDVDFLNEDIDFAVLFWNKFLLIVDFESFYSFLHPLRFRWFGPTINDFPLDLGLSLVHVNNKILWVAKIKVYDFIKLLKMNVLGNIVFSDFAVGLYFVKKVLLKTE